LIIINDPELVVYVDREVILMDVRVVADHCLMA
jgi:hypothetical protein